MEPKTILPENTYAAVVGVERYCAGSDWNLDGPASDAVRFLEYLAGQGVPKANLRAFLEPLEANDVDLRTRAQAVAASVSEPTRNVLEGFLTGELRTFASVDLFVLFWAGHGVISGNPQRRQLFTSDAKSDNMQNIDLNDLMEALQTNHYPNLNRQAFFVDTCANFKNAGGITLPGASLAKGNYLAGREQFALFAGAPGEYAKNLTAEKAGLFSRELMHALEAETAWPPDFARVGTVVAERFVQLRREGKSRQTPTDFWQRGWLGSEKRISDFGSTIGATVPQAVQQNTLSSDNESALRTKFYDLPSVRNQIAFVQLLTDMRPEIAGQVPSVFGLTPRTHAHQVWKTFRRYPGGLEELYGRLEQEDGAELVHPLWQETHMLLPNEVGAPK